MTPVRLAAARALLAVDRRRATLAAEIERARAGIETPRDRGLLIELTSGTLRWRNEIDAVIARVSGRAISEIEAPVLTVLRLGVYQLRHLDRVPAHAIVHESVDVVRALSAPRAAGFTNAVLRAVSRGRVSLPTRPGPGAQPHERVSYLTVSLSHPEWLVRRWLARYGFEATEAWCQFNNAPPETTIRPVSGTTLEEVTARLDAVGIEVRPATYVAQALRLSPGALGRVPSDLRARILVQDEASQLVGVFAGAKPGERVLDVCAAPGGKTIVMASAQATAPDAGSLIVSGDHRPNRVALLDATLARAGVAPRIVALDARAPLPFRDVFDRVLLDAPCSGLGTLRRDPDLKWSRQEADLPGLASDALRMLTHAAGAVRPGGELVYATCSSEPDENTAVVEAFLAADDRFALRPPGVDPASVEAGLVDARGCLTTDPVRHGLDAFFAAVLVRRQAA